MRLLEVKSANSYQIVISADNLTSLVKYLPSPLDQIVIVTPKALEKKVGSLATQLESLMGKDSHRLRISFFVHPNGEQTKSAAWLEKGWDYLGKIGFTRRDLIISYGGGVTTDFAGFLAATWHRGVRVVHVATTVLAMADASIGGKTGIDTPRGKNLVGSFYDPYLVYLDMNQLETLPQEEYRAGMAEIIKCGFIEDKVILDILRETPGIFDIRRATTEEKDILEKLIYLACKVKVDIVNQDMFESGMRQFLNYGHTLAHGIEALEKYQIRHGYAVAIGCVYAAYLALNLGLLREDQVRLHEETFKAAGLPIRYSGKWSGLIEVMHSDKKVRGNKLRFVLLDQNLTPKVYEVDDDIAKATASAVGIDIEN